jgi:hypothetical protein
VKSPSSGIWRLRQTKQLLSGHLFLAAPLVHNRKSLTSQGRSEKPRTRWSLGSVRVVGTLQDAQMHLHKHWHYSPLHP